MDLRAAQRHPQRGRSREPRGAGETIEVKRNKNNNKQEMREVLVEMRGEGGKRIRGEIGLIVEQALCSV